MNWLKSSIKDIFKGMVIGVANIIPGVSGGTMMVSMGIYDRILGAINQIFKKPKQSIKTLLPYVIGMGLAIVGLSFCIQFFFDRFPLPIAFLFIGLIFGGLPVILAHLFGKKDSDKKKIPASTLIGSAVLFLLFFALIVALQFVGGAEEAAKQLEPGAVQMIILFGVGIIASATMIIPGVSGAMILMALGYYRPVLDEVKSFVNAAVGLDMDGILHGIAILAPFGIGIIVGIVGVAKLIEFLLKKFEMLTYSAILGLVVASPVAVLMGIGVSGVTVLPVIVSVVTFCAGFYVAMKLSK